jgi:hypothetical protein
MPMPEVFEIRADSILENISNILFLSESCIPIPVSTTVTLSFSFI